MPGKVTVDLAPLWHREVRLAGAYAYGTERGGAGLGRRTASRRSPWRSSWRRRCGTGRLVSATYPLTRFEEAVAHAGAAGRRGRRQDRIRRTERTDPMSRRPGFVLEVDKSTPPTLFWNGEGFTLETLPEGSRVIYAPEPIEPIEDPYRAIRDALLHPVGDRDPLPALLRPGMKLTICFDDVSLPLPPMEAPDVRQMVIETVLDMAAEAGVDDVVLIAALALHRRMTEDELRHALGDRVYDAFAPHGLLTQHDAEDPDNLLYLGQTDQGEDVEINKRAATSRPPRLREHQPRVHGRRAQERGHRPGQLPQPAPPPQPADHARTRSPSWTSPPPSCTPRTGAWAASSPSRGSRSSRSRRRSTTTRSRRTSRSCRSGSGSGRCATGPPTPPRRRRSAKTPPRLARQIFHSIRSPHALTSVQAGEVEAVHALTTANVWAQQGVDGGGPDRHLDHGAALHLPLQRQLDHEPDPGGLPRARLLLQHVPGQAAGARGRRA